MAFKSDLEIAQASTLRPVVEIAKTLGIDADDLELYGKYKAKLPLRLCKNENVAKAKLVLVTAMTPTPAGEGKTTTSIGLCEGLNTLGKKTTVVLREPSLGPVFGMKGGAAGGVVHAVHAPGDDGGGGGHWLGPRDGRGAGQAHGRGGRGRERREDGVAVLGAMAGGAGAGTGV